MASLSSASVPVVRRGKKDKVNAPIPPPPVPTTPQPSIIANKDTIDHIIMKGSSRPLPSSSSIAKLRCPTHTIKVYVPGCGTINSIQYNPFAMTKSKAGDHTPLGKGFRTPGMSLLLPHSIAGIVGKVLVGHPIFSDFLGTIEEEDNQDNDSKSNPGIPQVTSYSGLKTEADFNLINNPITKTSDPFTALSSYSKIETTIRETTLYKKLTQTVEGEENVILVRCDDTAVSPPVTRFRWAEIDMYNDDDGSFDVSFEPFRDIDISDGEEEANDIDNEDNVIKGKSFANDWMYDDLADEEGEVLSSRILCGFPLDDEEVLDEESGEFGYTGGTGLLLLKCLLNGTRCLIKIGQYFSCLKPFTSTSTSTPINPKMEISQKVYKRGLLCICVCISIAERIFIHDKSERNNWLLKAYVLRATLQYELGHYSKSLQAIKKGLRYNPDDKTLAKLKVNVERGREIQLKKERKLAKAVGSLVANVMESSKGGLEQLDE